MKKQATVDAYIANNTEWHDVLVQLRAVLLKLDLEEAIKWNAPIYMYEGKNIIGMVAFKNHVSLWFHQGVFLKDPAGKLINANEENTRGLRQWRFTTIEEVDAELIKEYVLESIDNEKSGKRIKPQIQKVDIPTELRDAFAFDQQLQAIYEKLSPGKQREYCAHIGDAKQEATRKNRLEKCIPLILSGRGLYDKYK